MPLARSEPLQNSMDATTLATLITAYTGEARQTTYRELYLPLSKSVKISCTRQSDLHAKCVENTRVLVTHSREHNKRCQRVAQAGTAHQCHQPPNSLHTQDMYMYMYTQLFA